jgi:NADPH-dependent ferric siderophore reductase
MTTTAYEVIPTHVTSVVGVERVGSRFVRVTFGGGLERFDPVGPDQFLYLLVPPPGREELHVGVDFRWSDHDETPERDRAVGAYYTVRAHRPVAGELDIDVLLHDPAGHASAWAAAARPGRPAALWGPRTAWAPPAGTQRWLLVADETGVPAVEAILDSLPADADVHALVEVSDAADVAHVRRDVTLVRRNDGESPGSSDALVAAVRALELDPRGLYAWGGAESRAMRDVRRHLRQVVGLGRDQVSMTPYWRHAHHGDVVVDEEEA